MNALQVFAYQSNEVRAIIKDGEPWFCLVDVCRVLGISHVKDTADRLEKDEVGQAEVIDRLNRKQTVTIINESGLYAVILRSDKPEAKPFRKWVTSKVLPAIRKTGSYNALPDSHKAALAEAKLNNSRARKASVWLKLAQTNPIPTFQQICAHYASAELTGGEAVLPLPEVKERTYSAAEVGQLLGGVSANMVGRVANQNGLKSPEYGIEVWDKSPNSAKQVPAWRYNEKAVAKLRSLMKGGAPA